LFPNMGPLSHTSHLLDILKLLGKSIFDEGPNANIPKEQGQEILIPGMQWRSCWLGTVWQRTKKTNL